MQAVNDSSTAIAHKASIQRASIRALEASPEPEHNTEHKLLEKANIHHSTNCQKQMTLNFYEVITTPMPLHDSKCWELIKE